MKIPQRAWDDFASAGLPDYMRGGIERYVEYGIPPGRFMYCLLTWDFAEARMVADPVNCTKLSAYEDWMRSWLPAQCWGTKALVADWMESRREAA